MTSSGRQPEIAVEVGSRLPAELFGVIAGFLAGDLALGTIASLNVANKDIQACTLPVLYETVTIEDLSLYIIAPGPPPKVTRAVPSGFRYTKFLITNLPVPVFKGIPVLFWGTLFPSLVLLTRDLRDTRHLIRIYKPVNITTVLEDIAKAVAPARKSETSVFRREEVRLIISFEKQGRLLLDECEETRSRYQPPADLSGYTILLPQNDGLRCFGSFRTWVGRRLSIPLRMIALYIKDSHAPSTCGLNVEDGSRIYLALHRDEVAFFFKLLANTLLDGSMNLYGYPNIEVKQHLIFGGPDYTLDDIRASCVKEGLVAIVPQEQHNSLEIAIPNPSATQETFSISRHWYR